MLRYPRNAVSSSVAIAATSALVRLGNAVTSHARTVASLPAVNIVPINGLASVRQLVANNMNRCPGSRAGSSRQASTTPTSHAQAKCQAAAKESSVNVQHSLLRQQKPKNL